MRYPFKDTRWEGVVIEGFEFSRSTKSPGLGMFQELAFTMLTVVPYFLSPRVCTPWQVGASARAREKKG
jgi:hypothetical protein